MPATKYCLLRLDPGHGHPGQRATLTPLSIPVTPAGTWVSEFALSPDGSHLAMVSGRGDRLKLSVENLRAGTERTYRPGAVGNVYATLITEENSLSWGADNRTLAFVYGQWGGREGVRLLDTARHHGNRSQSPVNAEGDRECRGRPAGGSSRPGVI